MTEAARTETDFPSRDSDKGASPLTHASTSSEPTLPARHEVRVLESVATGSSYHRLRLEGGELARQAQPGQFVHILPRGQASAGAYDPLLRRAFSVMSTHFSSGEAMDGTGGWFEVLFRVGGRGTSLLAQCRVGDTLDVLGPLGNGFGLDRLLSTGRAGEGQATERPLFLVGGGIGVPPMVFAAQSAARANVSRETAPTGGGAPVEVFVGARSQGELVEIDALQATGARLHIATDDGSTGQKGLVTDLLRRRLSEQRDSASGEGPVVCACGPWPMLKAVARVCREEGAECYVSLEESMPCGIGVCNGCVVPVLNAQDDYGRFQRICVQGPVLNARSVDWGDATLSSVGPAVPAAEELRSAPDFPLGAAQ